MSKKLTARLVLSCLNELEAGVSGVEDNLLSAIERPLEIPSVSECVEMMENLNKISFATHAILRYTTHSIRQHLTQERKEK